MGADLLLSLFVSLVLTLVIEIAYAMIRKIRGRDLLVVILANCLTNPPVVLLHALCKAGGKLPMVLVVAILEITAVLVEWRCYKAASSIEKPFWFSLQANAISYLSGLLLQFF